MLRSIVIASMVGAVAAFSSAAEPTKSKIDPLDATAEPSPAKTLTSKDRVLQAMRDTADALKSRTVEPEERSRFVELLNAAEALRHDEAVPQHERDKWRGVARVRLVEGVTAMRRQLANPVVSRHVLAQFPAGGGNVPANATTQSADVIEAEKLIDIITTTVRPETWQDNGGEGVIRYWSLGSALIIYNTADVHERVGGFAGQVRP